MLVLGGMHIPVAEGGKEGEQGYQGGADYTGVVVVRMAKRATGWIVRAQLDEYTEWYLDTEYDTSPQIGSTTADVPIGKVAAASFPWIHGKDCCGHPMCLRDGCLLLGFYCTYYHTPIVSTTYWEYGSTSTQWQHQSGTTAAKIGVVAGHVHSSFPWIHGEDCSVLLICPVDPREGKFDSGYLYWLLGLRVMSFALQLNTNLQIFTMIISYLEGVLMKAGDRSESVIQREDL
ncbi:hypothetical protein B0H11DRAFT_1944414 [Mycena galericulata]|nr:hypothetical protein B0H11DRAFT_1944414 [Mycena galericulata]